MRHNNQNIKQELALGYSHSREYDSFYKILLKVAHFNTGHFSMRSQWGKGRVGFVLAPRTSAYGIVWQLFGENASPYAKLSIPLLFIAIRTFAADNIVDHIADFEGERIFFWT